jgi:hypothetical protein
VAIGAGFAYFLHKITPVFVGLRDLQGVRDYPVLGAFSLVVSRSLHREQRRDMIGFCAGAGLLPAALAFAFVFDGHLARLVQHFFVMGVA